MAGAGLSGSSAVVLSSGASSSPSTACSGGYSGIPSVSSRRRGDVWSENALGQSTIVAYSVESQCIIICLV